MSTASHEVGRGIEGIEAGELRLVGSRRSPSSAAGGWLIDIGPLRVQEVEAMERRTDRLPTR
jgi:hypothetical protein